MSAPTAEQLETYRWMKSGLIESGCATGIRWPADPKDRVRVACPNPEHPNSGPVAQFGLASDGMPVFECSRAECRTPPGMMAISKALRRAIEVKRQAWDAAQAKARADAARLARDVVLPPSARPIIVDDPYFDVECLDDVQSRAVDWEWPSRLLKGSLNLVVGVQGEGKSTSIVDLIARRTTGRPWPDGAPSGEPTNVLIFSLEEVPDYTIKPRCVAAGADPKRIFIVRGGMNLQADLAKLGRTIQQKQIGLVFLDPLSSYLPKMNTWNEAEVRRILDPVSRFAQDTNLTLVATMHLNKKTDLSVLDRVMGSVAFTAVPRSTILVAREATGRVLFDVIKHNYCAKPAVLAFTIESASVFSDTTKQPIETSRVEWSDEPVETTAQDVLDARMKRGGQRTEIDRAQEIILGGLAAGPALQTEMEALLKAERVSRATALRAKALLSVTSDRIPMKRWYWFPPRAPWNVTDPLAARDARQGWLRAQPDETAEVA